MVIKPINRPLFDKLIKTKMVHTGMTAIKQKIKNTLKPNLIIFKLEELFSVIERAVTDESEFESGYLFNKQVLQDFSFNVGRKIHMLGVAVMVRRCISTLITPGYFHNY